MTLSMIIRRLIPLVLGIAGSAAAADSRDPAGGGLDASVPSRAPLEFTGLRLAAAAEPGSLGDLFADEAKPQKEVAANRWSGFVQMELARTVAPPEHWSKVMTRAELAGQGSFSSKVRWKASARLDYDAVFDLTDFYPSAVRRDQRLNLYARENYIDVDLGDWDLRLGRQHVVWGEMVGLFFADVVSAKDMREFVLPDFDILRIPQWAARAEYSKGDFHAEAIWIPVPSYDEIGKPGGEFFPLRNAAPPGFKTLFADEVRPSRTLANTNYGLRLSFLRDGWDVSGFYYRSMDASPTFYRTIVAGPIPAYIYEARHDRISQIGGTLAKDFRAFVLKAETVYTRGRLYDVAREVAGGHVGQNTLDWAIGLDFSLPQETRFNVQAFQRVFFKHDPDIVPDEQETGYSLLLNHKLNDRFEAEALWIASFNRNDWLFRPRVRWTFEKNWRLTAGVDLFDGSNVGFAGRFANRDRVYTEIRYSF